MPCLRPPKKALRARHQCPQPRQRLPIQIQVPALFQLLSHGCPEWSSVLELRRKYGPQGKPGTDVGRFIDESYFERAAKP